MVLLAAALCPLLSVRHVVAASSPYTHVFSLDSVLVLPLSPTPLPPLRQPGDPSWEYGPATFWVDEGRAVLVPDDQAGTVVESDWTGHRTRIFTLPRAEQRNAWRATLVSASERRVAVYFGRSEKLCVFSREGELLHQTQWPPATASVVARITNIWLAEDGRCFVQLTRAAHRGLDLVEFDGELRNHQWWSAPPGQPGGIEWVDSKGVGFSARVWPDTGGREVTVWLREGTGAWRELPRFRSPFADLALSRVEVVGASARSAPYMLLHLRETLNAGTYRHKPACLARTSSGQSLVVVGIAPRHLSPVRAYLQKYQFTSTGKAFCIIGSEVDGRKIAWSLAEVR